MGLKGCFGSFLFFLLPVTLISLENTQFIFSLCFLDMNIIIVFSGPLQERMGINDGELG